MITSKSELDVVVGHIRNDLRFEAKNFGAKNQEEISLCNKILNMDDFDKAFKLYENFKLRGYRV